MWSTFSSVTKFSIVAFVVSGVLGLFSMGLLGYGLYYLIKPIMSNRIDELQGDTMWPSVILAGIAWSVSFLMAGWVYSVLVKYNWRSILSYFVYVFILWAWVLVVWFTIIHFKIVS